MVTSEVDARVRLLIVEDNADYIAICEEEFQPPDYELRIEQSRTGAMAALEQSYELVVCDLKIPSTDGELDADTSHGMAVLREVVRAYPGTPIIAFTAFETTEILRQLMEQSRYGDYLGVGDQHKLVDFFRKDELSSCIARVHEIRTMMSALDDIELATGGHVLNLTQDEDKVLRMEARKMGATVVRVSPLDGGRSGSRVLGLRMESSSEPKSTLVAKIGPLNKIQREKAAVDKYAAGFLPVGSFPSIATVIECGAGAVGGLFFQMAGSENQLLSLVASDPSGAADCVQGIATDLQRWREGLEIKTMQIGDLRASITGNSINDLQTRALVEELEDMTIHVQPCIQHNDLHAFNVLVRDGRGIVIDFARVGRGVGSYDAVTLELSIALHPDARVQFPDWPTADDIGRWSDLDNYVADCPYTNFVRACRSWAYEAAAGDREVWACAYAYAVRQLRYDGCPTDLVEALIRHLSERLTSG